MKTFHIADLFCGAGGTSTGAVEAIEALGFRPSLTAINHWAIAVETHTLNHPGSRHLCTSIDDINPRTLYKDGELNLLWASPECTHHSTARGGKPVNEQSRATAWCVPRWIEAVRPEVILVENVPEFKKWGPNKNGATFNAWVNACVSMGYQSGNWTGVAADFGDPTTRKRTFIQFVRGRRKIVWPDPTHCDPANPVSGLDPWVPASEIIDWELPGKSIYDRARPLSPKTLARILAGLEKFGLRPFVTPGQGERPTQQPRTHSIGEPFPTVTASGHLHLAEPFLLCMEHRGSLREITRPMPTITTAKGGAIGIAKPFLVKFRGTNDAASVDMPAPTITASGTHLGLAEPFLIHTTHQGSRRARSIREPMPTVAGNRGDVALCEPSLLPQHQAGALRPISQPAPTVATSGAIALIEPFLINYYGTGKGSSLRTPLDTVTTRDRFGLCRPVVMLNGQRYWLDVRFRMLQPRELAAAQGFREDYQFAGNKTQQVKQIGNAVPRGMARALVLAALSQQSDVRSLLPRRIAA